MEKKSDIEGVIEEFSTLASEIRMRVSKLEERIDLIENSMGFSKTDKVQEDSQEVERARPNRPFLNNP